MKTNLKTTLMLTAVVLTLSATAAYGQGPMTANIPFAFRTMAGERPAGNYAVVPTLNVLRLQNAETGQSAFLGIGSPESDSNDGHARLVFRCGSEGGCVLSSIWMGDGRGITYRAPRLKPSELEHVAVVYVDHK